METKQADGPLDDPLRLAVVAVMARIAGGEREAVWALHDLAKLARTWKPDGALPWVWARRRVTALVHQPIGTFAKPLDDEHLDLEAPVWRPALPEPRDALRALAHRHPSTRPPGGSVNASRPPSPIGMPRSGSACSSKGQPVTDRPPSPSRLITACGARTGRPHG